MRGDGTGRARRVSRRRVAHGGLREPYGKDDFVKARALIPWAALTIALVSGCGYTPIPPMDERVNAAESQIKVQPQRRADLMPNLVEKVKAYAKQEQTILVS